MDNRQARLLFIIAGVFISGCTRPADKVVKKIPEGTFSQKGSVREMTIPLEAPEFPEHPGKSEFVSYCAMCHSLKYITAQPDFPRKTWEAEVSKMIVKYKAPIDSVTGKKIVDYLVLIKTKPDQH